MGRKALGLDALGQADVGGGYMVWGWGNKYPLTSPTPYTEKD